MCHMSWYGMVGMAHGGTGASIITVVSMYHPFDEATSLFTSDPKFQKRPPLYKGHFIRSNNYDLTIQFDLPKETPVFPCP